LTSAAAVVKRFRRPSRQAAMARPVDEMTLAGAGVADQKDRFDPFEIAAFGQGADASCRNVRRLGEVELFEHLHPGQVRFLDVQLDGALFPILYRGLEQIFEIVQMPVIALHGFFGKRGELSTEGRQPQRLGVLSDLAASRLMPAPLYRAVEEPVILDHGSERALICGQCADLDGLGDAVLWSVRHFLNQFL
jgi:hypothetical protein